MTTASLIATKTGVRNKLDDMIKRARTPESFFGPLCIPVLYHQAITQMDD